MSDKVAAAVMVQRLAQIDALSTILVLKVREQLERWPMRDGHADLLGAIEDLLVDSHVTTRSEIQRFTVAAQARVDQEIEARKAT